SAGGASDALDFIASAGRFETEGYRDHSAATRTWGNAKVRIQASDHTTVTLVGNAIHMPEAQDPLGLSREQFESDPRSVDPSALRFNARKGVNQDQGGILFDHAIDGANTVNVTVYGGERTTQQFQAIPVAAQVSPLHPGGVIDLTRDYRGLNAAWTWRGGA